MPAIKKIPPRQQPPLGSSSLPSPPLPFFHSPYVTITVRGHRSDLDLVCPVPSAEALFCECEERTSDFAHFSNEIRALKYVAGQR